MIKIKYIYDIIYKVRTLFVLSLIDNIFINFKGKFMH